jgi:heme O synthase-like polyprenyltransferase
MATQHTVGALDLVVERVTPRAWGATLGAIRDYWALTKPEVNFLILVTTFAGFYLASKSGSGGFRLLPAVHTLLGTLLVASGTGTLNL